MDLPWWEGFNPYPLQKSFASEHSSVFKSNSLGSSFCTCIWFEREDLATKQSLLSCLTQTGSACWMCSTKLSFLFAAVLHSPAVQKASQLCCSQQRPVWIPVLLIPKQRLWSTRLYSTALWSLPDTLVIGFKCHCLFSALQISNQVKPTAIFAQPLSSDSGMVCSTPFSGTVH